MDLGHRQRPFVPHKKVTARAIPWCGFLKSPVPTGRWGKGHMLLAHQRKGRKCKIRKLSSYIGLLGTCPFCPLEKERNLIIALNC